MIIGSLTVHSLSLLYSLYCTCHSDKCAVLRVQGLIIVISFSVFEDSRFCLMRWIMRISLNDELHLLVHFIQKLLTF